MTGAAQAQTAGQVQIVVGSAQLIDAAGKARPVERGGEIRQGDRIVTADGALVQLKLTDGSYVSVRAGTDVAIEKYRYDEGSAANSSILLRLAQGALRSITGLIGGRNPDAYKVATPTATIGIRGTDHEPVFIPEPRPGETPAGQPGTYDKVNSGATFIQTQAGIVDIKPGQVGFVPVTVTAPPKVLPATPEFFKKLDQKGSLVMREGGALAGDKTVIGAGARTLSPAVLESGTVKTLNPAVASEARTISPTLSPTVINKLEGANLNATTLAPAASTLSPAVSPTLSPAVTSTVLQPAITPTIAPATIAPTTTIVPTAVIAPTTVTAPATISPTVSPTLSPTTISPILSPTTTIILK